MTLLKNRRRRALRFKKNQQTLRFTPYAWVKLLYLRDAGTTEVGDFGITSAEDLLLVDDVRLVRQFCTRVSVALDDAAVADHFDECVDAGLAPEQFARVWIHTHPGESAEPRGTDEATFVRVFGGCDWAVMAILAQGGESYARLRFSAGPGGDLVLPVDVDFTAPFAAADSTGWQEEYDRCVSESDPFLDKPPVSAGRDLADSAGPLSAPRFNRFDFPVSESRIWEFHSEYDQCCRR